MFYDDLSRQFSPSKFSKGKKLEFRSCTVVVVLFVKRIGFKIFCLLIIPNIKRAFELGELCFHFPVETMGNSSDQGL